MPLVWQPIEGFEGLYEVSITGEIRRVPSRVWVKKYSGYWANRKGRVLKGFTDRDGYIFYRLCKEGNYTNVRAHRAVLTAFVGPCPEGLQTRHLNGIRNDNRVENLAWGTPAEQMEDIVKHGNRRTGSDHHFYGRTGPDHWLYGREANGDY